MNKDHCCPYCGSKNICIHGSPLTRITLDDEGRCDSIDMDYDEIREAVDDLGPEDFAVTCMDCGKDCDIVFEDIGDTNIWRLVKVHDSCSTFDKKYELLFQYQRDKKKKAS